VLAIYETEIDRFTYGRRVNGAGIVVDRQNLRKVWLKLPKVGEHSLSGVAVVRVRVAIALAIVGNVSRSLVDRSNVAAGGVYQMLLKTATEMRPDFKICVSVRFPDSSLYRQPRPTVAVGRLTLDSLE
jgi:hypothetical protein